MINHRDKPETNRGLKRVTLCFVRCSWNVIFASTIFGTRRKDNWPIKLRKRRDVILVDVLGREPEGESCNNVTLKVHSRCFKLYLAFSISFRSSKDLSRFRKRKRKSLYCVFTLQKRALLCRSRAVTTKKCTKKRDARAKLFLNFLLFCGHSEGFQIWYWLRKNVYSPALNASFTFQPLMNFWISFFCVSFTLLAKEKEYQLPLPEKV